MKAMQISTLAHTVYKKCECCGRVRDIFFKLYIKDAKTSTFLVGDFDLCKTCGQNIGDILNIPVGTSNLVSEFKFSK